MLIVEVWPTSSWVDRLKITNNGGDARQGQLHSDVRWCRSNSFGIFHVPDWCMHKKWGPKTCATNGWWRSKMEGAASSYQRRHNASKSTAEAIRVHSSSIIGQFQSSITSPGPCLIIPVILLPSIKELFSCFSISFINGNWLLAHVQWDSLNT